MKLLSTPILILVLLSLSLTGWQLSAQPDTFVVGGAYVVRAGEVVRGNLQALFAQVTVEDGARVEGGITSLSSTLDLAGSVAGSVLAVESDVTIRATAQLVHDPRRLEAIPFVILLPPLARTGYAAQLPK
jgi:hypothetical protein